MPKYRQIARQQNYSAVTVAVVDMPVWRHIPKRPNYPTEAFRDTETRAGYGGQFKTASQYQGGNLLWRFQRAQTRRLMII